LNSQRRKKRRLLRSQRLQLSKRNQRPNLKTINNNKSQIRRLRPSKRRRSRLNPRRRLKSSKKRRSRLNTRRRLKPSKRRRSRLNPRRRLR